MIDLIAVTVIVLAVGMGGLYVATQPVRPSKRELREIQILESLKRAEEWMKWYATMSLTFDVPASSETCLMPFHNREILENRRVCGCCNCLQVFVPELIEHWTDGGLTACCPFCGVPSVVSEPVGTSLNLRTLHQMHHQQRRRPDKAGDAEPSPSQERP